MSERETEARHDISLEIYTKKIQIESRVMGDLALNHIVPVAINYQNKLITNVTGLKSIFGEKDFKQHAQSQMEMISEVSERITKIIKFVAEMTEERKQANAIEHAKKQAVAYCEKVIPYFEKIRYEVDKLELLIDNAEWPLPKYRELLFVK
jgi:glutamine synthetase